jgi:hypothetical protein
MLTKQGRRDIEGETRTRGRQLVDIITDSSFKIGLVGFVETGHDRYDVSSYSFELIHVPYIEKEE